MPDRRGHGPRPWRLFIALSVPTKVRDEIERRVASLRQAHAGRWVDADNVHLTLAFMGSRDPEEVPAITHAIGRVASRHRPFTLELAGAGSFGSVRRLRLVWLGVGEGRVESTLISRELAEELGLSSDEDGNEARPWRPHVTIGRDVPTADAARARAELSAAAALSWRVDVIDLVRSHLGRGAPAYETLSSIPLRPE